MKSARSSGSIRARLEEASRKEAEQVFLASHPNVLGAKAIGFHGEKVVVEKVGEDKSGRLIVRVRQLGRHQQVYWVNPQHLLWDNEDS